MHLTIFTIGAVLSGVAGMGWLIDAVASRSVASAIFAINCAGSFAVALILAGV